MRFTIFILLILLAGNSKAQYDINDTALSIPMFYATYSYQFPDGDLTERFGNNSSIGGGFMLKTRLNWMFGAEFNFLFGNDVKIADQIMGNLKTEDGVIINMAGNFTSYSIYERGFYISGRIGKLIPILSPNPNSGITLFGSLGYLQHKIRIEVPENTAPQLNDDYKRGYDRLAGGFGMSEFIGYTYLSNSKLFNFFFGFEINQAWTKPLRDVNFDTGEPDPIQKRFDLLYGIKAGWIIPLFERKPAKYYYY
jgi:hypothetical protein